MNINPFNGVKPKTTLGVIPDKLKRSEAKLSAVQESVSTHDVSLR